MAEDKKVVLMYADWIDTFEDLTDEEAGKLAKHIWRYINDLNPTEPDKTTKLAFNEIKRTLKRDLKKWEEIREKRRINGKKGGEASAANRSNPNQAEANGKQNEANPTVKDKVTVKVTVFHKEELELKFENLKKDKYAKEAYSKYNYSPEKFSQLINDFYQNCLEKQYTGDYKDMVTYLSNFHKTWNAKPTTEPAKVYTKL